MRGRKLGTSGAKRSILVKILARFSPFSLLPATSPSSLRLFVSSSSLSLPSHTKTLLVPTILDLGLVWKCKEFPRDEFIAQLVEGRKSFRKLPLNFFVGGGLSLACPGGPLQMGKFDGQEWDSLQRKFAVVRLRHNSPHSSSPIANAFV